jgi:uncharacterized protein YndB with AHSA1/START domain
MTVAVPTVQPVRKSVLVRAPRAIAFEVFTASMGAWWPMASHHIGAADCADVRIEPRVGGRWFERGTDGSDCDWGHVLAWEPPARVVLAWQLNATFDHDPALQSEVEVRFTALDAERTQVDLDTAASRSSAPTPPRCMTPSARRTAGAACSSSTPRWRARERPQARDRALPAELQGHGRALPVPEAEGADRIDQAMSSMFFGQFAFSRRDSARSASSRPPVWQRAQ